MKRNSSTQPSPSINIKHTRANGEYQSRMYYNDLTRTKGLFTIPDRILRHSKNVKPKCSRVTKSKKRNFHTRFPFKELNSIPFRLFVFSQWKLYGNAAKTRGISKETSCIDIEWWSWWRWWRWISEFQWKTCAQVLSLHSPWNWYGSCCSHA